MTNFNNDELYIVKTLRKIAFGGLKKLKTFPWYHPNILLSSFGKLISAKLNID